MLGEWGFRRLTLRTDARALVPRPETEIVVERALAAIAGLEAPRVVDVGTGSGAIALAIADEHPGARVTATDISPEALALARENAERLGLAVELVETNLLDGLDGPVRPRRLEPAVRRAPTSSPSSSRRCATGSRGSRSSAATDRASSRRAARACSRPAARSCSSATRSAPGESRRCSRSSATARYDHARSRREGAGGRGAVGAGEVAAAVAAIRAGQPVLLPTDGVYGLCASAREAPVGGLYELKGRGAAQPTAMIAASVEMLLECVPELAAARA